MKQIFVIIIYLLLAYPSKGQNTVTWIKQGNGFWNIANNWETNTTPSVNRIPNSQDTVIIEHDSIAIPMGYSAFARRIVLGKEKGTGIALGLFQNASLTIDDQVHVTGSMHDGIQIMSATLFNKGIIDIRNCQKGITLDSFSNFENYSVVHIDLDFNLTQSGVYGVENFGNINNDSVIFVTSTQWGIYNRRNIFNTDSIAVENSNIGLLNFDGNFLNDINAKVRLMNSVTNLSTAGTFINRGEIVTTISSTPSVRLGGSFTNEGIISMDNSDQFMISAGANVLNKSGAKILVKEVCLDGIIFNSTPNSLPISFINQSGAEIIIDPVTGIPFDTGITTNVFVCNGLLDIRE